VQTSRLANKGHTVFWLLGLLTVLLGSVTIWAVVRSNGDVATVEHTHRILTAVSVLEASVSEAESSVRGYIVNGQDRYIEEFLAKRPEAEQNALQLRELVTPADPEDAETEALSTTVTRRMQHLNLVIQARRGGDSTQTIDSQYGNEGRALISKIRTLTENIRTTAEQNLQARTKQRWRMQIALITLCAIGFLMSIGLVWTGQRAILAYRDLRDHSEETLAKLNAELEQRVAERTAKIQQVNAALQGSQAELTQLADALRRSNVELEKFAYAASHDLQEPVRNVLIFAELLLTRCGSELNEQSRSYLQTIVGSSKRMHELVQGLLEYARLNLDSNDRHENISLNDVLAMVQQNLRAQIQDSGATIHYSDLPNLTGSRLELIRLMQNLIGNSIKYRSPDRPCEIRISATKDQDYWTISVADNGIGFHAEFKEYIFGMLKRLDRKYSGGGFGLAICRSIVTRYGGRIWAESQEGRGSTFSFEWPVNMEATMSAPASAKAS
jgi:signal transduction histidine kinase